MNKELLEKLNKLKNLEEGARSVGSLEEASTAANKYQELLLKHNLSEEEVIQHGLKEKISMLMEGLNLKNYFAYKASDWLKRLIKAVSKSMLCSYIITDEYEITIVGESNNVAATIYILEQLVAKIKIAFNSAWKAYTGAENQKKFRRGFLVGAADAIRAKLYEQEQELVVANKGLGLMVISKRDLADKYMREQFSVVTSKSRSGNVGSTGGYSKGLEAGKNMSINKGITTSGAQARRLN